MRKYSFFFIWTGVASWNRSRAESFVATVVAGTAALGMPVEAADVWMPPKNPDPSTILNEAADDTRAGRYEIALAKHLWYHENALKLDKGQYGVRLSFALGYWMDLAGKYPPALAKLKELRDSAAANVLSQPTCLEWFHDFKSVSETLNEPGNVRELFATLHKEAPEKAKEVYSLAEPALILGKEYKLCSVYIDPNERVSRIIEGFQGGRKIEAQFGAQHKRFVERKMTNEAATLVALLAVNGRTYEAQTAAHTLKDAWDDKHFHKAIDTALAGTVPEPWP